MRRQLPKGILNAVVLASRVLCSAQSNVYSQHITSFLQFGMDAAHKPEGVRVASYSHIVNNVCAWTEWYVSTNDLAKQPRWNGFSKDVPLSPRDACAIALPQISAQFPEIKSWLVESVKLRNPYPNQDNAYPEIWCYEITFRPRDPQLRKWFEGDIHTHRIQIVLLDGTLVPER